MHVWTEERKMTVIQGLPPSPTILQPVVIRDRGATDSGAWPLPPVTREPESISVVQNLVGLFRDSSHGEQGCETSKVDLLNHGGRMSA